MPVSIAQNVSSAVEEKTDLKKAADCLRMAGMSEKMEKLPDGISTVMQKQVREKAVDLSGGEQQKVMIAKAVYKDGSLLVLDEPTSALDPIAESEIYQKYNEITKQAASVFISHRLASTKFCDRIILLSGGTIAEQGTHSELMERQGKYYEMYTLQSSYYAQSGGKQL